LETFYHNDSRIEEWVGQIIEKIFSTCLLTGVDADAEYQIGCENVGNLASLLKGFSTFPSEYLADGLQQIIEQQLPDSRVINNFPTFRDTMNKMLTDGMSKVNVDQCESPIVDPLKDVIPIPALASIHNAVSEEFKEVEIYGLSNSIITTTDIPLEHEAVINQQDELNLEIDSDLGQVNHIPEKADRLNQVLNYIFPNSSVEWNCSVLGYKFLAGVEDILICRYDPANPCQTEKFMKNGWKVMLYREEDLIYPRRLEREIKNILRLGKKSR